MNAPAVPIKRHQSRSSTFRNQVPETRRTELDFGKSSCVTCRIRIVLAGVCVLLCLVRVAPWYASRLHDGNDEPLGFLSLTAALWFLWRDRGEMRKSNVTPLRLALVITTTTAVLPIPMPPMLRALAGLAVIIIAAQVRQHAITVLLVLSLPVMASLQFYAGYPLRLLTAAGSHALLRACAVACERTGTMLSTPGGLVGVDAPCSGIRMWWTACVLALILMAQMRIPNRGVFAGLLAATALVIAGNILRATILFFPESGAVHWPEWTHEGTGAVIFALCTWALIAILERFRGKKRGRLLQTAPLLVCAALAVMSGYSLQTRTAAGALPSLPASFEGRPLLPVPPGAKDAAFAKDFPGRLSIFQQRERQVLWREVLQPTRALHSSLDCLRAAGWSVKEKPVFTDADGVLWGAAEAIGPAGTRRVRERIADAAGRTWTDVSSWWWAATLGDTRGPWTAITVIEP